MSLSDPDSTAGLSSSNEHENWSSLMADEFNNHSTMNAVAADNGDANSGSSLIVIATCLTTSVALNGDGSEMSFTTS